MGLNNSQNQSMSFLSIANGKIVRQFKEKTEKSVSRVNKMGREVHEEFYDSLTGFLKDVSTKESEYGKFWVIKMESDQILYQIEFNYSGGYSTSFLKALPNVDLTKQFTIAPKLTIDGDKKKSVMFINQNGGIKHYFTRDNPNGMPDLQKVKIKGKETWDDSDRMEFLEQYVQNYILPKIKSQISDVTEEEVPF
jgi:hypothetical protein